MHIALICPDLTGHLNPMTTLGRVLLRRGHRVSLVCLPESRAKAEGAGLEFLPIGVPEHEDGSLAAARNKLGELQGISALNFTGKMLRNAARVLLRDTPGVLKAAKVEAVVTDQVSAGASVAEALGLPFAMVCNALALQQEAAVPPPVTTWPLRDGFLGRLRNRLGNKILRIAGGPLFAEMNAFREKHNLKPLRHQVNEQYGLVQVAQQPAFFDFPRQELPEHFHYTGPWHAEGRDKQIDFPWEKLDGRPLIYASLGTLQNRVVELFSAIAAACIGVDAQLVLSMGRAGATLDCPLPKGAVLVPYAPQLELLRRASLVITHAGLNTALETLACGAPMVAIPLTNDQPGVARRLAWLGTAELVPPAKATPKRLRDAIVHVMRDPRYREASRRCQKMLEDCPTVEHAGVLIDHALRQGKRINRAEAAKIMSGTQAGVASGHLGPRMNALPGGRFPV